MIENLFLFAAKKKLRWATAKGELSVEQLFEVPLRPKPGDNGVNLDAIAKASKRALADLSEESFVETKRTPAHALAEARLEIAKTVIALRLDDEKKAEARAANRAEAARITEILAEKKDEKLSQKTEAELKKMLGRLTTDDEE